MEDLLRNSGHFYDAWNASKRSGNLENDFESWNDELEVIVIGGNAKYIFILFYVRNQFSCQ